MMPTPVFPPSDPNLSVPGWATIPAGHDLPPADRITVQQLRHQTKNALQRIMGQVARAVEMNGNHGCRRLVEDIEHRIHLTAAISDSLFGLTKAPGTMQDRLRHLTESMVELLGDPDQTIRVVVGVEGTCPPELESTVLRVAHELIGNAIKHGLYARLIGCITVWLSHDACGATTLEVVDDGWGCGKLMGGQGQGQGHGQGLGIAAVLAAAHNGTTRLERRGDTTVATMELPAA